MFKQYIGKHSVNYNGYYDGTSIRGVWSIGNYTGKFKLTKTMNAHIYQSFTRIPLPEHEITIPFHTEPLAKATSKQAKCQGDNLFI